MIDGIIQTVGVAMNDGWMNFKEPLLNELLPEVKPLSTEAFFQNCLREM